MSAREMGQDRLGLDGLGGIKRETDGGVHALYRKNEYNNHCL